MRVLVIEDDRKVASFIQAGLSQEGHAVDVLNDGVDAGAQALSIDYDIVVLDLMLPGRSDSRSCRTSAPASPRCGDRATAKSSLDERVAGRRRRRRLHDQAVRAGELSARLRAPSRRGAPGVRPAGGDRIDTIGRRCGGLAHQSSSSRRMPFSNS